MLYILEYAKEFMSNAFSFIYNKISLKEKYCFSNSFIGSYQMNNKIFTNLKESNKLLSSVSF